MSYLRAADHLPLRFNSAEWFVARHFREGRGGSLAIVDAEGEMTYAGEATVAELRAFVKESLAPYKCPKNITFVSQLPKTATGKLKRYLLRDQVVLSKLSIEA